MSAHDVRHIRVCPRCKCLGDRRHMINLGETIGVMHGRCAINTIGLDTFLQYPREELAKLTLDDIGVAAMKAILNDPREA